MLSVKDQYMPKWGLAAIIELTGEIPEQGQSFRATSAGNQMELPADFFLNLDKYECYEARRDTDEYKDTHILNDRPGHLDRYLRSREKIVMVNDMIMELYDPNAAEEGEDIDLEGGYLDHDWMYWYTIHCSWACGIIKHTKEEKIAFQEQLGKVLATCDK